MKSILGKNKDNSRQTVPKPVIARLKLTLKTVVGK
jgi:hypothetical protein